MKWLVVGKPHSQVERETWSEFPSVLNVPRDVLIEVTLENLGVGLSIGIVDTQQRIGEGVICVERVAGVVSEINLALNSVLRITLIRSPLIVDAELEDMLAPDLGQVVDEVVDHEALVERPEDRALWRTEVAARIRVCTTVGNVRDAIKQNTGNQVRSIRVGIK